MAAATATSMVLALLGGLGGPAAYADDDGSLAPASGSAFDAQAVELLELDGVQAVTADDTGTVVLAVTGPVEELAEPAEEFVAEHDNVEVRVLDAPFDALASTNLVGGAGYVALAGDGTGFLCSVGFNGFSPAGRPAVISAGHCTDGGSLSQTMLTVPAGDTAGGGSNAQVQAPLGTFGFSQFGGVGNSYGTTDRYSTDVSVIDVTNTDLVLPPVVTNWRTPSDLSASSRPVNGVGTALVGAQVVKSGRTTGLTEGIVASFGWANVDGHLVYGFQTNARAIQGDSGGAVLQGGTAVGLVSGGTTSGGQPIMWAADLQTALARTGGYTVAVNVPEPVVTSPAANATVASGSLVTGTAPAGTALVVRSSAGESFEVAVTSAGTWSFPVGTRTGTVRYTLTARSGYSTSNAVTISYTVVPPNALPIGSIDSLSATGTKLTVTGWALDPDTTASIQVHVYVDGKLASAVTANGSRPDVDRAYGKGAAHGYSWSSTVAYGSHTVCVYGIDSAGGPNPSLGCRTVSVTNALPIGAVDGVSVSGTRLSVSGWALDPDTTASIQVHVYVDGKAVTALSASGSRPDVDRVYGKGAAHGYSWSSTLAVGDHTVCVYAIDSAGGPNPSLGCRRVVVTNALPIGSVDAASVSGTRLTVSGWALDPDTRDPIAVHVYVDGKAVTALTASGSRPDVDRVYGKGAAHGYSGTATVSAGRHQVCVYAIDSAGGVNPLLGCRSAVG